MSIGTRLPSLDDLPVTVEHETALAMLKEMASLATFQDVAGPRKRAEPETQTSPGAPQGSKVWKPDLRYRSLVEKLPVVTFMASLDDTVQEIYVSPQIEALLGFTQAEWLDNPILWFSQLHPDDRDSWVAGFAETVAKGSRFRSEYRMFARDGRVVWIQGECQVVRDEDGRPLFLQGVAFDITHIKRSAQDQEAKLAAEAANHAKSDFLARMSHEIRTPLNGVVGMIDLLRATDLSDAQLRYAQLARDSADALLRVINDILDFSKIEAGKVEVEAIEFELGKLVEDLTEVLAPVAAKKGLGLLCSVRNHVPRVVIGDPNRVRQVLTNLVNNALKFTERGYVSMRVSMLSREGDSLVLRVAVEDTGIGIPPDRRDRLFKSFSQVDSSTTRKFGGTGLGLAISKQLVELMGGEVGIESEVGRGTTFWFTLKLTAVPNSGEATASAGPAEALRDVRVLAVEPDPAYRRVLTEQLEDRISASSAVVGTDEALAVLQQATREGKPFSVVLMPFETSEAQPLLAAIHSDAALNKASLIAVTALDSRADAGKVKTAGFSATVKRPLTQSRLLDAITSVTVHRPVTVKAAAPAAAPTSLQGLHLLVAEDNEMNQFVTQETLRRVGCSCEIVGDGAQALAAVQKKRYDAVLMDCQMPEMDGLEASRRIRQWEGGIPNWQRTPIIALTAEAIQGDREKCLGAGMDGYVTKPINAEELYAAIRGLVTKRPPESLQPAPLPEEASAPIDVEALLARCMNDATFASRTLDKFRQRATDDVELLRRGVAAADAPTTTRLAHNLKAVAGHVAAGKLREIAYNIEQAGIQRDMAFIERQLDALAAEARLCADYVPTAQDRIAAMASPAAPLNQVK